MIQPKIISSSDEINIFYRRALTPEQDYRPYQAETLFNLSLFRAQGKKRAYVVYGMGGGKTTVAAIDLLKFTQDFIARERRTPRLLWLAHRNELLDQAEGDVADQTTALVQNGTTATSKTPTLSQELEAEREEAIASTFRQEERELGIQLPIYRNPTPFQKAHRGGLLILSIQTMYSQLHSFHPNTFDYIVLDEAHHVYAPTYLEVLEYLQPQFLLGLTGTPFRFSDGRHIGDYFENLAMEKDMVSLAGDDYLTSMFFIKIATGIEISGEVRLARRELMASDLWRKLNPTERDKKIIQTYLDLGSLTGTFAVLGKQVPLDLAEKRKKPALTFCLTQTHAKQLAVLYSQAGIPAAALTGDLNKSERRRIRTDFQEGRLQMLCAPRGGLLDEGGNYPPVELVLLAAPMLSKTTFLQEIGRGSRLSPATGKTSCLVLDLVDGMRSLHYDDIFRGKTIVGERESPPRGGAMPSIFYTVVYEEITAMHLYELFGGDPPLAREEMSISRSDPTFQYIEGTPAENARTLKAALDAAWEALASKTENRLVYREVEYFRRTINNNPAWGTKQINAPKVAASLGKRYFPFQIDQLDSDEMGITEHDATFKYIDGVVATNATALNSALDRAWEALASKTENRLIYQDVEYFRCKSGPRFIWGTKKENLPHVAASLGKLYFPFPLSTLATDEMGITGDDPTFNHIEGGSTKNARTLNSELDQTWKEKADKSQNALTYKNVHYFRRMSGTRPVWGTKQDEAPQVAISLGKRFFPFSIPPLATTEMGITGDDTTFQYIEGGSVKNARTLNTALDQAWEVQADKSQNCLIYQGVTYFRRKSGPQDIWATAKTSLPAVATSLQKTYFLFRIDPLTEGEMGIVKSDPTFQYIEGIPTENARTLNEQLDNAWEEKADKSENQLPYQGVTYFRRLSRNMPIWGTLIENALAVACSLHKGYFPFQINQLGSDEMGITSRDPDFRRMHTNPNIAARALNAALNAIWETNVNKTTNTLMYDETEYFRRMSGSRYIWGTKKT